MAWRVRYGIRREYIRDSDPITREEFNRRYGVAYVTPPRPDPPLQCREAWDAFWRLSGRRHSGPEPIGIESIYAFCQLTHSKLTPQEVLWIEHMDEAFMAEVQKEKDAERDRQDEWREIDKMSGKKR